MYGLVFTRLSHNSQQFRIALDIQNSSVRIEYQLNSIFSPALMLTQTFTTPAGSTQIFAGENMVFAYRLKLGLLQFIFEVWDT